MYRAPPLKLRARIQLARAVGGEVSACAEVLLIPLGVVPEEKPSVSFLVLPPQRASSLGLYLAVTRGEAAHGARVRAE